MAKILQKKTAHKTVKSVKVIGRNTQRCSCHDSANNHYMHWARFDGIIWNYHRTMF